jgi:hypothetical protein
MGQSGGRLLAPPTTIEARTSHVQSVGTVGLAARRAGRLFGGEDPKALNDRTLNDLTSTFKES